MPSMASTNRRFSSSLRKPEESCHCQRLSRPAVVVPWTGSWGSSGCRGQWLGGKSGSLVIVARQPWVTVAKILIICEQRTSLVMVDYRLVMVRPAVRCAFDFIGMAGMATTQSRHRLAKRLSLTLLSNLTEAQLEPRKERQFAL